MRAAPRSASARRRCPPSWRRHSCLDLARKGVSGQQGPQPIPADRPDNLWHPVPGPYAAHGTFDEGASTRSLQLWATTHRTWLLAGVGAAAGLTGLALGLRQQRRH